MVFVWLLEFGIWLLIAKSFDWQVLAWEFGNVGLENINGRFPCRAIYGVGEVSGESVPVLNSVRLRPRFFAW